MSHKPTEGYENAFDVKCQIPIGMIFYNTDMRLKGENMLKNVAE